MKANPVIYIKPANYELIIDDLIIGQPLRHLMNNQANLEVIISYSTTHFFHFLKARAVCIANVTRHVK